jgi:WD40 repeat protein
LSEPSATKAVPTACVVGGRPGQADTSEAVLEPYVGLRPFQASDSHLFFGRRPQVRALLELLEQSRFLPVVGSSGCGKSSLVRAGLIPALEGGFLVRERDEWQVAMMTPGDNPLGRLVAALSSLAPDTTTDAAEALRARMLHDGVDPLVTFLQRRLGARGNLLLCVDQFEEIFAFRSGSTAPAASPDGTGSARLPESAALASNANDAVVSATPRDEAEVGRTEADLFVELLLELSVQRAVPIYIVLTMRSDFLGDCDVFRGLPEAMNESRYLVPRLTREQLSLAIEGPARLAGARLEPRLLDRLLNDIGDRSDQLPVVQHALLRTWQIWKKRNTGDAIGQVDYRDAGTLDDALAQHAEEALKLVDRKLAAKIFQALTDTDARKRRVRRASGVSVGALRVLTGASTDKMGELLLAFVSEQRHFLTLFGPPREPGTLVSITHESLIRQWKVLRDWVDEERQRKEQLEYLARRVEDWKTGGGTLLRKGELASAEHWCTEFLPTPAWAVRYQPPGTLEAVLRFIKKSQNTQLIQRLAMVGIVCMALLAAGQFVSGEVDNANERAASATERALAADLIAKQRDQAKQALRMSADLVRLFVAARSGDVVEGALVIREVSEDGIASQLTAWSEIASMVLSNVPWLQLTSTSPAARVALAPDGLHIVSSHTDRSVRLWTLDGPNVRSVALPTSARPGSPSAFSADGTRFATLDDVTNTLRVWTLDGTLDRVFERAEPPSFGEVAISSNFRTVWHDEKHLQLWDPFADRSLRSPPLARSSILELVLNADATRVAATDGSGRLLVWSAEALGKPVYLGGAGPEWIRSVALPPNGNQLVVARNGRIVMRSTAPKSAEIDLASGGSLLTFSADGKNLAYADDAGNLAIVDVEALGAPRLVGNRVLSLSFNSASERLAAAAFDGSIKLWKSNPDPPVYQHDVSASAGKMALARHGRRAVMSRRDQLVVWDDLGARARVLPGVPVEPWSRLPFVLNERGTHIAVLAEGSRVRVFDFDGKPVGPSVSVSVNSLALSESGDRVAGGSYASDIRIWNSDGKGESRNLALPKSCSGTETLAFAPTGDSLAVVCSNKNIAVWELAQAGEPASIESGESAVKTLVFSADGRSIASGALDGSIRIWRRGTAPFAKDSAPVILRGHRDAVTTLAFSADGERLVSGSRDATVRVWPSNGSGHAFVLAGDRAPIGSVRFDESGEQVVSVAQDGIVRVRPTTAARLLRLLWAASPQCLGVEDRQTLLKENAEEARASLGACRSKAGH